MSKTKPSSSSRKKAKLISEGSWSARLKKFPSPAELDEQVYAKYPHLKFSHVEGTKRIYKDQDGQEVNLTVEDRTPSKDFLITTLWKENFEKVLKEKLYYNNMVFIIPTTGIHYQYHNSTNNWHIWIIVKDEKEGVLHFGMWTSKVTGSETREKIMEQVASSIQYKDPNVECARIAYCKIMICKNGYLISQGPSDLEENTFISSTEMGKNF